MTARPSRAKMCSWLSGAIRNVRISPTNPADIKRKGELERQAKTDLLDLSFIASELGWHADASLDEAWELIQQYDADRKPTDSEHEQ